MLVRNPHPNMSYSLCGNSDASFPSQSIDKTNYTELSESINSMYEWYRQSRVCYAYLEDVPSAIDVFSTRPSRSFDSTKTFERSKWFTRGWTLQELIAPEVVEFLARDWTEVGTKASLAVELAHITGIDARVLNGADVSICNVAERLSWAASRKTTKVEDAAYCLLGIFGVNMPLIYGEDPRPFTASKKRYSRRLRTIQY